MYDEYLSILDEDGFINIYLLLKMMKNILMPGGIGYIGSHVAIEVLLETNHHITIVDNYINSGLESLDRIFESVHHDLP